MNKLNAPKGTKDIYSPEVEKWQYFENQIREYFKLFSYREVRTPIFERSELFSRGIGNETEVVQKEMYTFEDKAGRSMTLRPENTASVVRSLIEHNLMNELFPHRFFYIGPMFRYDKPQKGRYRQFHQFGVEVFGDKSPYVDAEVIFSAIDFLKSLKITEMTLYINSVGCSECRPDYLKKLSVAAENNKEDFCNDCKRKIDTNPLRIFDCKVESCIALADKLPKITGNLCEECDTHYKEMKFNLELLGLEFQENNKLVRGLDYYTKTAFEITSSKLGAQNAILGGGRYNNLVKELGGQDLPGIGFSGGMERILLNMDPPPAEDLKKLFVAWQGVEAMAEAFKLSNELRKKGYIVYMDYSTKKLSKQLQKGIKFDTDFTLILAEDELMNNEISIKNFETREQITIKREELDKWLKKNC
ncbi:MAG: histidine--tRNA ligase [Acidobacteriota bacterium]